MGTAERTASRWLLPAVLVITGAAVGAGMVARELYQRPAQAQGDRVVLPNSSEVPPSARPGDSRVGLSADAAQHPDQERIRVVLQDYFDAINNHAFGDWRKAVTKRRAQQTEERAWESDYESTKDGSIVVQRVESDVANQRVRVMMSFVSTQDVGKAPPELPVTCIRWRVVYVLAWEGNELRVDVGPENRTPQYAPC